MIEAKRADFIWTCLRAFKVTKQGDVLDDELRLNRVVLIAFSDDPDLNSITQALEFCTDKHDLKRDNIYGRTENEINEAQYDLLRAITNHVLAWLRLQNRYPTPILAPPLSKRRRRKKRRA